MADDFGSAQPADLTAGGERPVAGQAKEETTGIKIAGPSGVDDPRGRCGGDAMLGAVRQDHAPCRTPGQGGDRDVATYGCRGGGEVGGLVERADLRLVGEEDVDLPLDEAAKRLAVTPDAERVGEAQRHLASG